MEKNRKLIIYGLIIFLLFLIFYLIYLISFNKKQEISNLPEITPLPTYLISPTLPQIKLLEKITAGGINVADFHSNAQEIMPNKDAIITRNRDFQLVYYARGDYFHLSILNSPFEEVRLKSEKELLKILDISQIEACQLHLTITTPLSVNPSESGQDYPLSFCT